MGLLLMVPAAAERRSRPSRAGRMIDIAANGNGLAWIIGVVLSVFVAVVIVAVMGGKN